MKNTHFWEITTVTIFPANKTFMIGRHVYFPPKKKKKNFLFFCQTSTLAEAWSGTTHRGELNHAGWPATNAALKTRFPKECDQRMEVQLLHTLVLWTNKPIHFFILFSVGPFIHPEFYVEHFSCRFVVCKLACCWKPTDKQHKSRGIPTPMS